MMTTAIATAAATTSAMKRDVPARLRLCYGEVCLDCGQPIVGHGWRLVFAAGQTHAHLGCLEAARRLLRAR